jgi:hypothetical protein
MIIQLAFDGIIHTVELLMPVKIGKHVYKAEQFGV